MKLTFRCPSCEATNRVVLEEEAENTRIVTCNECHWSREASNSESRRCLVCGCEDLWRQKDFPQAVGLAIVAIGATLSSVAWAWYEPLWAIGILLGFAALDLVLFALMPDVLVCYRCRARYGGLAKDSDATYDHELGERYHQESLRTPRPNSTTGSANPTTK